jgi:hypothetical protein
MDGGTRAYFTFRFILEGVTVNCGTSMSVKGNSIWGIQGNLGQKDLTRGFSCIGTNHFHYSTYEHTQANAAATGLTSSTVGQQFYDSFPSVGVTWDLNEYIIFYITINTLTPAV